MSVTTWEFYTDTEKAWEAIKLSIEGASVSIDLEQYIFSFDSVGLTFIEALKERARSGVKVRIFCDTIGSYSLYRSGIKLALEEAGIEIKFFNPVFPWHPNKESLWYFRDHKKLMIIDKKFGFTGGVCLGEAMRTWRDSYVRIEGPVVGQMQESFDNMWHKAYHKFRFYLPRRKKGDQSNGADFKYLSNSPIPGKRYMYRELIRAVKASKHYIYLTTPYLLPDSRLLRNLKEASERGVEIRILVPKETDTKIVTIGMHTFFEDLLKHGIRIFEYGPNMLHSKTGIIDGRWSTVGSLNLDNLSLRYNFEGNIVSIDKSFAFELEKQFLEDLKLASELTLSEWNKRSSLSKLLETLVWPFRKLL